MQGLGSALTEVSWGCEGPHLDMAYFVKEAPCPFTAWGPPGVLWAASAFLLAPGSCVLGTAIPQACSSLCRVTLFFQETFQGRFPHLWPAGLSQGSADFPLWKLRLPVQGMLPENPK